MKITITLFMVLILNQNKTSIRENTSVNALFHIIYVLLTRNSFKDAYVIKVALPLGRVLARQAVNRQPGFRLKDSQSLLVMPEACEFHHMIFY